MEALEAGRAPAFLRAKVSCVSCERKGSLSFLGKRAAPGSTWGWQLALCSDSLACRWEHRLPDYEEQSTGGGKGGRGCR